MISILLYLSVCVWYAARLCEARIDALEPVVLLRDDTFVQKLRSNYCKEKYVPTEADISGNPSTSEWFIYGPIRDVKRATIPKPFNPLEYKPTYNSPAKDHSRADAPIGSVVFMWNKYDDSDKTKIYERRSYHGPYEKKLVTMTSSNGVIIFTVEIALNPLGPTGIWGLGLLFHYGPNHAVDCIPVIFNKDICGDEKDPACYEIFLINRPNGNLAVVGGFVEFNKTFDETMMAELLEEGFNYLVKEKLFSAAAEVFIANQCIIGRLRVYDEQVRAIIILLDNRLSEFKARQNLVQENSAIDDYLTGIAPSPLHDFTTIVNQLRHFITKQRSLFMKYNKAFRYGLPKEFEFVHSTLNDNLRNAYQPKYMISAVRLLREMERVEFINQKKKPYVPIINVAKLNTELGSWRELMKDVKEILNTERIYLREESGKLDKVLNQLLKIFVDGNVKPSTKFKKFIAQEAEIIVKKFEAMGSVPLSPKQEALKIDATNVRNRNATRDYKLMQSIRNILMYKTKQLEISKELIKERSTILNLLNVRPGNVLRHPFTELMLDKLKVLVQSHGDLFSSPRTREDAHPELRSYVTANLSLLEKFDNKGKEAANILLAEMAKKIKSETEGTKNFTLELAKFGAPINDVQEMVNTIREYLNYEEKVIQEHKEAWLGVALNQAGKEDLKFVDEFKQYMDREANIAKKAFTGLGVIEKVYTEKFKQKRREFIYGGHANDGRDTDIAWVETTMFHLPCDEEMADLLIEHMEAGDDAKQVRLTEMLEDMDMYAGHPRYANIVYNRKKTHGNNIALAES